MYASSLMDQLTADSIFNAAYAWVCKTRLHFGPNHNIWDLRFTWVNLKSQLIQVLRNNTYHLSPLKRYRLDDKMLDCWEAQDALMLKALAANPNLYYVRYMDDWLVLVKTRHHLRKAIKLTEQILTKLHLVKHPAKTFIGWISAGFDFLGYHLSRGQLKLSNNSIQRHHANIERLIGLRATLQRLEQYWIRWVRWTTSGLTTHITTTTVVHASRHPWINLNYSLE